MDDDQDQDNIVSNDEKRLRDFGNWYVKSAAIFAFVAITIGIIYKSAHNGYTDHQHDTFQYVDQHLMIPLFILHSIVITLLGAISYTILYTVYDITEVHFPHENNPIKKSGIIKNLLLGGICTFGVSRQLSFYSAYIIMYFYNWIVYGNVSLVEAFFVLAIMFTLFYSRKLFWVLFVMTFLNPTIYPVYLCTLVIDKVKRRYQADAATGEIAV